MDKGSILNKIPNFLNRSQGPVLSRSRCKKDEVNCLRKILYLQEKLNIEETHHFINDDAMSSQRLTS